MSMVQRLLRGVLAAQCARPWLTLFVALALVGLSVFYTMEHLQFRTSQRALLSQHDRLVRLSEEADQFSDFDTFVVAIENREKERSLRFLHALVPELAADHRLYRQVFSRVDPAQFKPWALLYMDNKDLRALRDALTEHEALLRSFMSSPGLVNLFDRINDEMAERMVGELFTGFLKPEGQKKTGPPDLRFLIGLLREMKADLGGKAPFSSPWGSLFAGGPFANESEQGYFWTDDKRYLLIFVTPMETTDGGFSKGQASLARLRETIARVKASFPDIHVGVTGKGALGVDEMGAAMRDMGLATMISLVGLAVLLILFWRGICRPLIEIITLVTALAVTFGLTTLFIGHLNLLSVVFTPMLLGLGIDYGVHWFARYQEEQRRRGASDSDALQMTMTKLGPAILLAGLTAALSFFPLVLTGFKGLAELGIICAIGLVLATAATLCLLPALLVLFDKKRRPAKTVSAPSVRPFLRLSRTGAVVMVVIALAATGFSLHAARGLRFDLNMLRLQSRRAESVIWEKKLIEGSRRASIYGVILARSLDEVDRKTKALKALPTVSDVVSAESPLPEDQGEKLAIVHTMRPVLAGVGQLPAPPESVDVLRLEETLGRIRFKMLDSSSSQWRTGRPLRAQMSEVRELIDGVVEEIHRIGRTEAAVGLKAFQDNLIADFKEKLSFLLEGVGAGTMEIGDLPKTLQERYIGKDGLYMIQVFPKQDVWDPDLDTRFVRDLRSVDPDAVGDPITLHVFTQAYRDASVKAALYALLFIAALLALTLRSPVSILLVLVPLAAGSIWTFGLMRLAGIELNLANSIFLPLILGAGVEYGIIIVQRWREGNGGSPGWVCPSSTGWGVVLAGLSTTVGFGSLTISEHHGVHSLGLLTTIGSLSVLGAAVLFLPALIRLVPDRLNRRKVRRSEDASVGTSAQEREEMRS